MMTSSIYCPSPSFRGINSMFKGVSRVWIGGQSDESQSNVPHVPNLNYSSGWKGGKEYNKSLQMGRNGPKASLTST